MLFLLELAFVDLFYVGTDRLFLLAFWVCLVGFAGLFLRFWRF